MNTDNAVKLFHNLTNIFISSQFGNRISPINGKPQFHNGVDYSANGKSVPTYAIEDGVVLSEGMDNSGGIFCYVHYPRMGYVGLYYHLNNTYVSKGDKVNKDTKLGMTGTTGMSTGIHLHFSWFKYQEYSKPMNSRTYEDYNAYSFVQITPTVPRNENVPQIRVLVESLNVRTEHNTTSKSLGYTVKNGIYNDLETYKDATYTWHRIADNQWVADNGTWLELLPVIDYEKLYNEQLEINKQLQQENDSLKLKLKDINKISTI